MLTIGDKIKLLRGDNSQAEFAAILEIPQMTLSNYEKGKSEPKYSLLVSICTKLSINSDWLLFERGPMRSGEIKKQMEYCQHCIKLEAELEEERKERRELGVELREVNGENRRLTKENAILREENVMLRTHQTKEQTSFFDEHQPIPPSSLVQSKIDIA